jgi:1-aminocyclopropane-1-carboxylate deaminase
MRLPDTVPVTALHDPLITQAGISVDVLRLDLIDPVLNGNKPFKLIDNLAQAKAQGHRRVLSFGGAWSNHIHAMAEAGYREGLETVAVIRGDDPAAQNTATLDFAVARGMRLIRVSRADYRRRHEPEFLVQLQDQHGPFYLIPEGGANAAGVKGCQQLAGLIRRSAPHWPDEIALACGTGATLAGLVAGLHVQATPALVRGVAVLKGADFLHQDIRRWLPAELVMGNWALETAFHFGGYACYPAPLREFVSDFESRHGMLLDPVYTAKLFAAVYQRVQDGCYRAGTRLLLVHSGGLQGRAGLL